MFVAVGDVIYVGTDDARVLRVSTAGETRCIATHGSVVAVATRTVLCTRHTIPVAPGRVVPTAFQVRAVS